MSQILMPKATAVWLIDNTSLSFDQIGVFCSLHPLEAMPGGAVDEQVDKGAQKEARVPASIFRSSDRGNGRNQPAPHDRIA